MANKQINELSELTTASGVDLLVVYDMAESGSEKTKKVSVDNLLGGAWVLTSTAIYNNEGKAGNVYYNVAAGPMEIIMSLDVSSLFTYYFQWGEESGSNNYVIDSGASQTRMVLQNAAAGKLHVRISIDFATQISQHSVSHSDGTTATSSLVTQEYLGTPTGHFKVQIYEGGHVNSTGYINLYEKI